MKNMFSCPRLRTKRELQEGLLIAEPMQAKAERLSFQVIL